MCFKLIVPSFGQMSVVECLFPFTMQIQDDGGLALRYKGAEAFSSLKAGFLHLHLVGVSFHFLLLCLLLSLPLKLSLYPLSPRLILAFFLPRAVNAERKRKEWQNDVKRTANTVDAGKRKCREETRGQISGYRSDRGCMRRCWFAGHVEAGLFHQHSVLR